MSSFVGDCYLRGSPKWRPSERKALYYVLSRVINGFKKKMKENLKEKLKEKFLQDLKFNFGNKDHSYLDSWLVSHLI